MLVVALTNVCGCVWRVCGVCGCGVQENLTTQFSDPYASPLLFVGDSYEKAFWQVRFCSSSRQPCVCVCARACRVVSVRFFWGGG